MAETFVDRTPHLRVVLDSIPSLIFILDSDLRVIDINSTAKSYVNADVVLKRLCGEVLHCIHDADSGDGCGRTPFCEECILRQAVETVGRTHATFRNRHRLRHRRDGTEQIAHFFVTASPLDYQGETLVLMILQDVTELLALRTLVTMCSVCNSVRNDEGGWETVHQYLRNKENILTSHGLCPSCYHEQRLELERVNELIAAGSFQSFGRG